MNFTTSQKQIIDDDLTIKHVRLEFPDSNINDITAGSIYQEAMSLEESLFEGDTVSFGSCNASVFKVRVADFMGNIENQRMNVYIDFLNDDLGNLLNVPFGKYIVSQPPERTSDRRWLNITAMDYSVLFDVDVANFFNTTLFPTNETERTIKQCRELFYSYIGIQYENVTLPNDGVTVKKTVNPTTLLGREYIQKLLELNGCFGHFDYDGVFRHIILESSDANIVDIQAFINDCNYDDYDVSGYNTVYVYDDEGTRKGIATTTQSDKVAYVIENNYFIFGLDADGYNQVALNILSNIVNCPFRKNQISVHGGIYIELGNKYTAHPKLYNVANVITNTFKSYCLSRSIQGILALTTTLSASANSVSDTGNDISTQIEGLYTRTNTIQNDLTELGEKVDSYILYDNQEGYEMRASDVDEQTIISIQFLLNRKCYVVFHATIVFEVTTDNSSSDDYQIFNDGSFKFTYYINDEKVNNFDPEYTYQDGKHTLHIHHAFYDEIDDSTLRQSFKIKCKSTNCLMYIPIHKINGYLTASGLYFLSDWDGTITASEEYEPLAFDDIIGDMTDNISARIVQLNTASHNDTIQPISFTGIVSMIDNASSENGMLFSTTVNRNLLSTTATVSNNSFTNGSVITPNIYGIEGVKINATGGSYTASFDGGSTWLGYSQTLGWITGITMSKSEIESVLDSDWISPAMIKAELTSNETLQSINVLGGYINV